MMLKRSLQATLPGLLDGNSAVGLLGPRQVGKTTIALEIAKSRPSVYLDLEDRLDAARLDEPEDYFAQNADKLVILDEIQTRPNLFKTLRGQIDRRRRAGYPNGQFLILGSASIELIRQSAESLAGRIAYTELSPVTPIEIGADRALRQQLWLRGGFPSSFTASSDTASMQWRENFIRTYLERDIPALGSRVAAETLRRFWTMLAHTQGGLFNGARLATSLAVSTPTVLRYLDLLVDLLLVRRLQPWASNAGKRLVRQPKVYIRDSGLVHALLRIITDEQLTVHPVGGFTWEGQMIEAIAAHAPRSTDFHFYRTAAGAEIDLLLRLPGDRLWAIEFKRSHAPKAEKGFRIACDDLNPERAFVCYPGQENFPLAGGIRAAPLDDIVTELAKIA